MNTIKEFMYDENAVRTMVDDNDVVWFVGNDVSKTLGYSNYRNAVANHVEEEDKLRTQIEYAGQKRTVTLINESGMYSLILSSKLPSARKFKHWVTSEVLPNIRKHGAYLTNDMVDEILTNPDTIIQLATQLKESRAKNEELEKTVQEQAPKVEYTEKVLASEGTLTMRDIAKDFGLSAMAVHKILREEGIIFKQGKSWNVYSKYQDLELTKLHTYAPDGNNISRTTIKWTHKGYKFIVDTLQGLGYEVNTVREF